MDPLTARTLDAYRPTLLLVQCERCGKNREFSRPYLVDRFGRETTLGEVTRRIAATGCTLAKEGDGSACHARPQEPSVELWASLYDALHGRWRLLFHCGRRLAGLKRAVACEPLELHVPTLAASLGSDMPLLKLPGRLRCPGCEATLFHLEWIVPDPDGPQPGVAPLPPAGPPQAKRKTTLIAIKGRRAA